MVKEKNFLIEKLKDAGIKSVVYTSMKRLKTCNELHLGAVLTVGETFTRSGSKKIYEDQDGRRKRRKKLFQRNTVLKIVIADAEEEKCEVILLKFLQLIGKGMAVDGNWVNIAIGEAEWVEADDSILKSKIAVEFEITFQGGIYEEQLMLPLPIGSINRQEE